MSGPTRDHYPTVTPYLLYEDVGAALAWLRDTFGFEERLRFADDDGIVSHAEMTIGEDGLLMLGHPGPDYRDPHRIGGGTALVHVLVDDVDPHAERARAAGARILRDPEDQSYGHRRYDVEDLAGHTWSFSQHLRDVAPTDWGATEPSS
jgi:uncharacterized glyoxalase superfamily protein PhnB